MQPRLPNRRSFRPRLERLEDRLAPASVAADVFARFQDSVNDPPEVSGPLFANVQASVGPDVVPTVGRARAEMAGRVQGLSQVGGISGGPGPTDESATADTLALQTADFVVQGLPAGTTVALDATVMLSGFLETQNFASLSADLTASVLARLTLTTDAGTQIAEGNGALSQGTLSAAGLLSLSDFVLSPGSTFRTPHYDLDLTRTIPGVFTVTAGEMFTVEARLETFGFVEGPFELFTTADFFTDTRGLSFTLAAPGGAVVPVNDADLALTRSGFTDPVPVGSTVNYTLTVTNNGPNAATGVTLTDTLHDGLALISVTPSQGSFSGDEQTLVYDLGNLLPGRSATVDVVARANQVGTFPRTAGVTAEQPDPDTANNTVSVTTIVRPAFADLVVTIDDTEEPVRADRPIPYTITVTNHGPDVATGVELILASVEGFLVYSSIPGRVSPNEERIDIPLGGLAPGASVTLQAAFYTRPDWRGLGSNLASGVVSADQPDPTPDDAFDIEETTLIAPPPPPYDFTLIARDGLSPSPSINNAGAVAFLDDGFNSPSPPEILTGSSPFGPGSTTVVADTSGPFGFFGSGPSINDTGTVAFLALNPSDPAGEGIFTGSGGPITTIADATGPLQFSGIAFDPSINNVGQVAFRAGFDAGGEAIFLGDGSGPPVPIADSFGAFRFFGHAQVNDGGQVAFHATLDAGGEGIFLWDDGTVLTLADTSGPFAALSRSMSLNDLGAVAFFATLDNGESGVFIAENGTVRTHVDSTGPFRTFGSLDDSPAINNAGKVAFRATLDTGLFGIFTGPDPEADRVIARGDQLPGGNVTGLDIDRQGLNDAGQLAFWVRLNNRAPLIVRADLADNDADGVLDLIEQGAPGGGDGNGDGTPDRLQANVTSLPDAVDGRYVTLVSPPGTRLADVQATGAPFPRPLGATFPFGVVGFAVEGLSPGQAVDVELIVPGTLTSSTYFKQRTGPVWYPFEFDGTTGARAEADTVHGGPVTRFTLALVDGNPRGDQDGSADGRVVDPGGPAFTAPPVDPPPVKPPPVKPPSDRPPVDPPPDNRPPAAPSPVDPPPVKPPPADPQPPALPAAVSLAGSAFLDYSGDGRPGPGEPGLAGRSLFLDANGNGLLDPGEPAARADAEGAFRFAGVAPGSYRLQAVLAPGEQFLTPAADLTISLAAGDDLSGADVGLRIASSLLPPAVAPPAPGPAPDADTAFVWALYRAILGREPGGSLPGAGGGAVPEYTYWTGLLASGVSRAEVVAGIWGSPEHIALRVGGYYRAFLGREPDPLGLAYWGGLLAAGAEGEVVAGILASPEYAARFSTPAAYAGGLYRDLLGREPVVAPAGPDGPAVSEAGFWAAVVDTDAGARGAAEGVAGSAESGGRLLGGLYAAYLGRPLDVAGWAYWLGLLTSGRSPGEVARGILASDEFFARAGRLAGA